MASLTFRGIGRRVGLIAALALVAAPGCTAGKRLGWMLGLRDDPGIQQASATQESGETCPRPHQAAGPKGDGAAEEAQPAPSEAQAPADPATTPASNRAAQAQAQPGPQPTRSRFPANFPADPFTEPSTTKVVQAQGAADPNAIAVAFQSQTNLPGASVYGELNGPAPATPPARRNTGVDNLAQISFSLEGEDFDPDVSSDGSFVVYASTQHARTADIYMKSVEGRTVTQLTNDTSNNVMPSISPDGRRIAFASDRGGSWDIYVMNRNGGQAVQITDDPTHELSPSWSPDGSRLVFSRLGQVSGQWELWVTEVDNPAVRQFISNGLLPEWSPVDDKIVFQKARQRGDRYFSVWTIDYIDGEGVNPTEIISSPIAATVNPTWSPDGRRIAFAVIPNPTHEFGEKPVVSDLWICNIDGTGRANLTGGLFANLMPEWGPNGRLFFISDRSGRDNIWSLGPQQAIIAASGGRQQDIATVPTEDEDN